MRELKFRAWDCDNEAMKYEDFYGKINETYNMFVLHPERKIMQYTGLKDKNGKEIYESDVIKYNGENVCYICLWDDENAWRGFRPPYGWMFNHPLKDMQHISKCEIFGNIYENPELLNNK